MKRKNFQQVSLNQQFTVRTFCINIGCILLILVWHISTICIMTNLQHTIDIVLKFHSDYFNRNRICHNIVTWSVSLWFVMVTWILYTKRCVCLSFTICTSQLITSYDLFFVFYCNKKKHFYKWYVSGLFFLLVIFKSLYLYKI